MLNLYRRHPKTCKPGKKKGSSYVGCNCPVWCDGELNGARPPYHLREGIAK
jgi:hypothetical protein